MARSSGSLYCLSGQIPIGNPLLTLGYVASVKNVMLVGCRPNYNLKLNVRITTLQDLVPSSALVYCTLNNLQHKCEWFKIGGKEQWPNGG